MQKILLNNEEMILNCIRRYGPISKALIAKKMGITPPTVSNICTSLMDRNLIFEDGEERAAIGRPSLLLRFNNELEKFLIVHIRTHSVHLYVTNWGNEICLHESFSIIDYRTNEIMEAVYENIEKLLALYGKEISSIGLILRGPVDSNMGISIYSPNGKWRNVPFKYILEERFNLPVYVDNDVRALAIGEYYYGKGAEAENLLVIKFSFGLGATLIYKGELYRGYNENAGEIGNMLIQDSGGELIRLEDVASETALRNYVLSALKNGRKSSLSGNELISKEAFRVEPIYEAALDGDELAVEALNEVGHYLGIALANIINVINPERIVISSAMGETVTLMEPVVRPIIEKHSHRIQPVELVYSGKGSYYTILGMIEIISTNRIKEGNFD